MQNNQVIALFGAGYIGRYLVPELCKAGYRIKIATRNPYLKNYLRGNPGQVELVTTEDTNYKIYLQVIIRNADGQLINVTESTANGAYIPHMISDHVFDTLMSEKEIITVDGAEYEKAQWRFNPSVEHRFIGLYPIYSEVTLEFVSEPGQDTTKLYEAKKDFSIWKIHYCADWEDFGYSCIPVFQVLVPNMTVEPTDTVEHQWTILREVDH